MLSYTHGSNCCYGCPSPTLDDPHLGEKGDGGHLRTYLVGHFRAHYSDAPLMAGGGGVEKASPGAF